MLEGEENKTLKGKSASKSEPVDSGDMSHVTQEIERVNGALEVLALKAGNPATSLAEGMRANREQIELADYLKGLRFALGEGQE